jgi:surface antigen
MSAILRLLLTAALLLSLHPVSARAQMLGPSWETYVTLSQADLDMIKGALGQQIHNQQPGTSASWRNPTSGNSGSVTLLKTFARQGRRCDQIEYRLNPPENAKPSDRFVLTSCMQPDGTWKLS